MQSSKLTELFSQNRGNIEEQEEISGSFERNPLKIQGTISHKTHLIREWLKSTSPRFLKRLKGGSLKNLPNNFSQTESRILRALSKRDEFLLNPQVRPCSVAVPATSKNDSGNRGPTGDHSLGDHCPKVVFSAYHSCNLNNSEQQETHHN